jgi:predicted nucleic acid-binding protein
MKSDERRFGIADNNLVVSAFLQPEGVGAEALRRMGLELELLASEATLAELLVILNRPKFDRWVARDRRIELFARSFEGVIVCRSRFR